jgi:hypothetical protein
MFGVNVDSAREKRNDSTATGRVGTWTDDK